MFVDHVQVPHEVCSSLCDLTFTRLMAVYSNCKTHDYRKGVACGRTIPQPQMIKLRTTRITLLSTGPCYAGRLDPKHHG